jgi:divalent metal cation (Fe/Co/Zn/Cd) transporter
MPATRATLELRARRLAATSVAYNVVEAAVSMAAGVAASSVALVGFGLDSIIEMSSGLIIVWQFRHELPESRERRALRMIAVSFFALAAYITVESLRALWLREEANASPVGIALAAVSLVVMPAISRMQRNTGRALGSTSVVADSKQALLCTYLSGVLLVGLALNATLSWWWADSAVGLVVAVLAVLEGREAWAGDHCDC